MIWLYIVGAAVCAPFFFRAVWEWDVFNSFSPRDKFFYGTLSALWGIATWPIVLVIFAYLLIRLNWRD